MLVSEYERGIRKVGVERARLKGELERMVCGIGDETIWEELCGPLQASN